MTPTPHNEKAAAEMVGALILVSIFCVVIAIIAVAIFSTPPPEKIPALNMQFAADTVKNTITIQHTGGDPIPAGQYQVLVGGVDVTQYVSSSGTSGNWALGDTLTVNDPYIVVSPDTRVEIVYTGGGHGTYLMAVNGTESGITTGGPPVPAFTYSISGLTVTFTDLSTGGLRPLNYVWTFGDMGAGNTSTSPNPVHSYASPGTYSVFLSVSNSTDAFWVTSAPQTFTVYPPPPVASFSASNTSGYAPLVVRFTDSSSGSPTSWLWTFGDMGAGNTSTLQNPLHTYFDTGPYTVTLTATNSGGSNTATYTNYITVIQAFTINATAGANGSIDPAGDTVVIYGEDSPIYTITNTTVGYHVADVLIDGVSNGTLSSYQFTNVQANHTISASFAINTYNINVTAGSNGAITPGNTTVNYGDDSPIYTITNTTVGYHIADVLIDGVSNGTLSSYQFTNVQEDHTISATFAINTYDINVTAGPNGAITPGNTTVNYGSNSPIFTITNTTVGYHVADVLIDGVSNGTLSSYQFTNVVANHTISASFAINTYDINVTAGPNGAITPGNTTVNYGDASPTYSISPFTGYHINNVTVDGVVGNFTSYQFTNVQANHTISATFAINQFTITASSGPNGVVTPTGVTVVNYGANQSYNITPGPGYLVESVTVDGSPVGQVTMYNFTDVFASHTISATFAMPPVANFTASPLTGPVPLSVSFTDLSANATSWVWNFGYNGTSTSTLQNPTFIYENAGNYTVSLKAINAVGDNTMTKEGYIFVYTPVVANFTGTPTSGPWYLTVTFTDLSTGGPSSWYWEFGDSWTLTTQNPQHTYSDAGLYSVNLTVANAFSSSYLLRPNYINVTTPPPVADIYADPTSGTAPLFVSFYDLSTGFPTSWLWNFGFIGAGNTSTSQDTSYTYINPGNYNVSLTATNVDGSSTAYTTITVNYPVPTVTAITPAFGPASGGTTVTITGTGFNGTTAVSFGATPATGFTVVNGTSITATSPAGTGVVDVTVTTPGGTSATSAADRFTYGPTVTAVSPTFGPVAGGTSVTLTGTGFTGATAVRFNNTAGTGLTVTNATSLTITSPAGVAGVVHVNVTTPNGTSANTASDQFTYVGLPTVTAVSPAFGPIAGGTSVTLTGTGFTGATAVRFNNTAGTGLTVTNATSLTITSPAGVAGVVHVNVTTPNGTSLNTASDQFTYASLPTVTAVSPAFGPIAGGTSVTLTGTGFNGATVARFNNTAGTGLTVNSDTSITITSPAGVAGVTNVNVTTPNGTSLNTASNRFTYVPLPTVTAVSPAYGPVAGGTVVTLTGTGFTGATAVRFNNTAGTSLTVNSATSITITSPAGVAGVTNVNVTTPNGTSLNAAGNQFTYVALPTVTSVNPAAGLNVTLNAVTISGTGLTGATLVTFGGTAATGVSVVSSTTITATTPVHPAGVVNVVVTTPNGTATGTNVYTFYNITKWTSGATNWVVPPGVTTVEYIVVGGGGGGGYNGAAGGGAGGYLHNTMTVTSGNSLRVAVGAGGTGGTSAASVGRNGGNSSFANSTVGNGVNAYGGGGGAGPGGTAVAGLLGGSGGGSTRGGAVGAGITGQGFAGGAGVRQNANTYAGGGGGGATQVGFDAASGTAGGAGGAGSSADSALLLAANAGVDVSGTRWIAGGGGGGARGTGATFGGGGNGGGGDGSTTGAGAAGTVNSGGGGGGGANAANGGAGGSGIVIIKFY